jgi:cytochrome c oxidase cbb3-type subunit 3
MRLWSAIFVVLALLAPAKCLAQDKAAGARPDAMDKPEVRQGKAQFEQSCAMCHGSEAKGGVGPNLVESSLVLRDVNGNLIEPVIRNGRETKGMPAFPSLTATQVTDIVAFLHAAAEIADNVGDGGPKGGYSLQRLLTGNAADGKRYFDGEGGCVHCHSVTGDLKGIAKKYRPVELEGNMLFPTDHKTVVVTLPSGEKVKGQLLHLDAFYVSLIDQEGNYRSWPLREGVKTEVEDPLRAHEELLDRYTDKNIHDLFAYLETLQ